MCGRRVSISYPSAVLAGRAGERFPEKAVERDRRPECGQRRHLGNRKRGLAQEALGKEKLLIDESGPQRPSQNHGCEAAQIAGIRLKKKGELGDACGGATARAALDVQQDEPLETMA